MSIDKLQKRPYKATVLAGIFLGAAFLKICLLLFRIYPLYSWQYLLMDILPAFLIYLFCGLIVLARWVNFSFSLKAVFVGIGVHYLLTFLYAMTNLFFSSEGSLSTVELWLFYYPEFILNPFDYMYNKFIIMPRTTYDGTGAAFIKMYHWETGLLFPIMGIAYAGLVGFCFGKLIYLYRNDYLSRFVKEITRYSYISFVSILLGIFGYVLVFTSEEYFLIFFLLSILSIVFGHISKRRIKHSEFQIKGEWLSITGLLLGYTLFALTIIIFMRFNHYI